MIHGIVNHDSWHSESSLSHLFLTWQVGENVVTGLSLGCGSFYLFVALVMILISSARQMWLARKSHVNAGFKGKITALNDGGSIATFDYNGGGLLLCFVLGGITMIWLSEADSVFLWCFWSFLLPNHVILMACVPGAAEMELPEVATTTNTTCAEYRPISSTSKPCPQTLQQYQYP